MRPILEGFEERKSQNDVNGIAAEYATSFRTQVHAMFLPHKPIMHSLIHVQLNRLAPILSDASSSYVTLLGVKHESRM